MKAMLLTAPKALELGDRARPEPGPGQTLVRVTESGICGTDLKIFQGGIPVAYPRIMGHESVGEVVASERFGAGTRVLIDPCYFCGKCYQCRQGQTHLCPNGGLIGRDVDGGFAEYVIAPDENVFVLPEGFSLREAPLLQPMTTCVHGLRMAGVFPGDAVIVLGLGVTGLLHVQLAKAAGAYPVIGITRSKWKRELAERLGADITFEPSGDVKDKVLEATGDRGGADLVIESVGQLPILAQSMDLVRLGGRILPFGIYTAKEGALPFYQLYLKEIQIVGARAAKSQDFPASIEFVQRGAVDLKPLITHTFPLERMDKALDMLDSGDSSCIKIILEHAA